MFLFQISHYDDPALETEAEELFRQRLETYSRQSLPGLWKITDAFGAGATQGPGGEKRPGRYRLYGLLLLALGVFVLVPGLAEPGKPGLILAGMLVIIAGLTGVWLGRRKPSPENQMPEAPAAYTKAARSWLEGLRAADWADHLTRISFDEAGMTVASDLGDERVPYGQIQSVFETERLWLLVHGKDNGLLLQKQDLISGNPHEFMPYIRQKISAG